MKFFKRYRKIYIFPNWHGFTAFLLFVVMILAGATYQNNLVFMMAFLLLSIGLIAILQTARNLRDIEVLSLVIEPGFPSQTAHAKLTLKNNTDNIKLNIKAHIELRTDSGLSKSIFLIDELSENASAIATSNLMRPPQRGLYKISRIKIVSEYPYGLFRAWTFLNLEAMVVTYPSPLGTNYNNTHVFSGDEDFTGYKNFEKSDNPSRIDWKVFSRRHILLTKEFKAGGLNEFIFNFDDTTEINLEKKLSQLSLWIHTVNKDNHSFKLATPQFQSRMGKGQKHYEECMLALARYQ